MNKVMIVSLLFNRQPFTKLFIENLINNTNEPFDLVLWDNGSQDPTQKLLDKIEKLKFKNGSTIKIIRNEFNHGIASSLYKIQDLRKNGQHFMKIDNDVAVPKNKNWLKEMINIIENNNNNIHIVGYPPHGEDFFYNNFEESQIEINGNKIQVYYSTAILACCFIASNKFFDKFRYKNYEKKYGIGCDGDIRKYIEKENLRGVYIRPKNDMITFLECDPKYHDKCPEANEYHQWKLNILNTSNEQINNNDEVKNEYNFIPTLVGNDESELNIDKELLIS